MDDKVLDKLRADIRKEQCVYVFSTFMFLIFAGSITFQLFAGMICRATNHTWAWSEGVCYPQRPGDPALIQP